jgi:sulfopyruvate decarboxylase subunit beta
MGLALPVAVGLAVARPDTRVLAVEGDGGLAMHLGALVTLGAVAPANLTVLLIVNGVHAASGGQPVTNPRLDWATVARATGLARAERVGSVEAFVCALDRALAGPGPSLLALDTEPDVEAVEPREPINPPALKQRFMTAVGAAFRL